MAASEAAGDKLEGRHLALSSVDRHTSTDCRICPSTPANGTNLWHQAHAWRLIFSGDDVVSDQTKLLCTWVDRHRAQRRTYRQPSGLASIIVLPVARCPGCPAGIAAAARPNYWCKDQQVCESHVSGCPKDEAGCTEPSARSWPRPRPPQPSARAPRARRSRRCASITSIRCASTLTTLPTRT